MGIRMGIRMGKRAKVISDIERQVSRLDDRPGLCLYYAHYTASVLHRHGYHATIQAGSLQWPRIKPEDDDGVMNTHFAYMWTPMWTPGAYESALSVLMGNLPEMHCWVGIIDTQEIVDFTTRHLKTAAANLDLAWTAADPPEFLWCASRRIVRTTASHQRRNTTAPAPDAQRPIAST